MLAPGACGRSWRQGLDARVKVVRWGRGRSPYEDEFLEPLRARSHSTEWTLPSGRRVFRPPCDVFETDEQIVVKVEIAGMREEDFSISLDGYVLRIGGTRGDSAGKLAYERMEINYGEFRLDIRLPHMVELSQIDATYEKGFLLVRVPRRPQRRRIPIAEAKEG